VTICIEAKADEPFGNETVGVYRQRMLGQRQKGKSTRAPERIDSLLHLVGHPNESAWTDIPYQLLTAFAGTVLQARIDKSDVAVFVVHEFHTGSTEKENLLRNAKAFSRFVSVLMEKSDRDLRESLLYYVGTVGDVEVLLGKVVGAGV
jgi:hypothetical protein